MRIQLLTHSYSPEHSPPQRRWMQFNRYFRSLGWDIDVITPVAHAPHGRRTLPKREAGRAFRRDTGRYGERILRVPYLWHRTTRLGRLLDHCFSAAASVAAGMATPRPDVVVVTVPSLPILGAGYAVSRLRRVPLVVDMRDAWPDIARDARIVRGSAKSLTERAVVAFQERADLVVTVTYGFASTLRDRGLGNVATVVNGVDISVRELLPPPPEDRDRLNVLYLGNHGESQRLDLVVRAAALARDYVRLTMVGHGVQRRELMALAEELDAPVTFHGPAQRREVMEFYRAADTCVISLRDDWKSFETTIPSKTYEVLAVGRHVTGIVRGEARQIIEDATAGDVVESTAEAVAQLWKELQADRIRLLTGTAGRDWVHNNANLDALSATYADLLRSVAVGRPE
ncbi:MULTISPECIES: glycosyltransferase family 4 protein [unclassified Arthrobacter]|uniref:glycosyltransferase family 4 protein n=1 Tax=unclassified Arthrobacter TaxID=235627 RepID=UPI0024DF7E8C|nr:MULTISPECIES: glycosyltransferase family 4 protein [unclassified Arthrobacter]MCC9145769.1 glycosyltransferase family 4 protein [Arthrobacter sp. zg-Y919]MDK1276998.1 glycosyltransferase family 4 protein [Arthrobacter sp. zg.Y919]WIB04074.1 glycosyltransferase family 4 protein [Arthrobacter sp. zg-Y919]